MDDLTKEVISEIIGRTIKSITDLTYGEIEAILNYITRLHTV